MDISERKRGDRQRLARMIARESNAMQRDRPWSVLLVLQGRQTLEVTATVGRSRALVQRWAYAYRDGGIEAVHGRMQPGRPPRLSPEQETRFVQRVKARAATGWSLAMPLRDVNTATMQAFLEAAASELRRREHAVMILDGVGWHKAHKLRWLRRITPLLLPPYSPELNPVERLWHWLREHHWSDRTYADEQALVEEAIRSHRTLRRKDIRSICRARWITHEDQVGSV